MSHESIDAQSQVGCFVVKYVIGTIASHVAISHMHSISLLRISLTDQKYCLHQ